MPASAAGEPLNTFDGNGNYIKTEWKDGDLITDSKLNKIEDAIYEINADKNNGNPEFDFDFSAYALKSDLNNYSKVDHTHDNYATKDDLGDINAILDNINGEVI